MISNTSNKHFLGVTLTGVDEYTPIHDVLELMRNPTAELAFLYSLDSDGPRFVSERWMRTTFACVGHQQARLAIHVCGVTARQHLMDGGLSGLMPHVSRVQVNGDIHAVELPSIGKRVPHLITQQTPVNVTLADYPLSQHSILVDGSSGTGRLTTSWGRPITDKAVGFAGGLSLSNMNEQLRRIDSKALGNWWVDLETGLRTSQDLFSPQTAFEILDVVENFKTQMA